MTKEDYMRLTKERLAELLAERDAKDEQLARFINNWNGIQSQPPCYAPDGVCTNPQMDCINCPKTWQYNNNFGTTATTFTQENLSKNE